MRLVIPDSGNLESGPLDPMPAPAMSITKVAAELPGCPASNVTRLTRSRVAFVGPDLVTDTHYGWDG